VRFTTLMGAEVVSSEGDRLGRLVDLRCERGPEGVAGEYAVVSHVVFGRVGWIERLGFLAVREEIAEWKDVASFRKTRIELASSYTPRKPERP